MIISKQGTFDILYFSVFIFQWYKIWIKFHIFDNTEQYFSSSAHWDLNKSAEVLNVVFANVLNFLNENYCILIQSSLKFVPKGVVDDKSALVHVIGLLLNKWHAIIWPIDS